jgi:hypothetical protein
MPTDDQEKLRVATYRRSDPNQSVDGRLRDVTGFDA